MKYIFFITLASFFMPSSQACILRRVINNSPTTEILIRSANIRGLKKTRMGSIIPPRAQNSSDPLVVDVHSLGMGEYMRAVVTEKTTFGKVCKKYRIYVNEQEKKILFQKKDGCEIGKLVYDTLYEVPINPDNCYVDLYLHDDANSLSLEAVASEDAPTDFSAQRVEKEKSIIAD